MKKNKYGIILFIVGIILLIILIFKLVLDFCFNGKEKELSYIDLYGYKLTNNDSKLFKSRFKDLESILNSDNINYEEYARIVSELFVIDIFSLDNKLSSTDIGGLQFLHPNLVDNFKENMGSNLYKNVYSNIDGNREQELPNVSEIIESKVENITYNYNDKDYDGYDVYVSFKYEVDLGYQDSINITLIKDNNKLFIVKGE